MALCTLHGSKQHLRGSIAVLLLYADTMFSTTAQKPLQGGVAGGEQAALDHNGL